MSGKRLIDVMMADHHNGTQAMPNKYPEKKGWDVPKQKYKVSNWADYNESLRLRGDITVWLSNDAIESWYEKDRAYDGTGSPLLFSDFTILTCHEIRQVYRLPLRQCQGFINSLFKTKKLPIVCPDYSTLSKRLMELKITSPRYTKKDRPDDTVHAIAIDSTGLKRFGGGANGIRKNTNYRTRQVGVSCMLVLTKPTTLKPVRSLIVFIQMNIK